MPTPEAGGCERKARLLPLLSSLTKRMRSFRVFDRLFPGRTQPAPLPGVEPSRASRDLLLHTWAGQLFLISAGLKIFVALLRLAVPLPQLIAILSSAATVGLIVSVSYFVSRLFLLMKRRLLWRVRRKLILSYIFIGVVPALLIIAFFTLGAFVISTNVSAYLFRDGYDDLVSYAGLAANAAAAEMGRNPATTAETVARVHRSASTARRHYQALSIVFIPTGRESPPLTRAGEWSHGTPPDRIPAWLNA